LARFPHDLDSLLTELMRDSRRKLDIAIGSTDQRWQLEHGRVVVGQFGIAEEVQKQAMASAKLILVKAIQSTPLAAFQAVDWVRPHLEDLNRSLIEAIPRGKPEEYQQQRRQHEAIFAQRLNDLLSDIETEYSGLDHAVYRRGGSEKHVGVKRQPDANNHF
jgi:hypothetical protein